MLKRVAGVIIKNNKILLMRRVRDGREYFVFPGGGVEENETIEEAIIREIKEKLSIDAKIDKLLFEIENQGRQEYYYLIKEFSGQPKLGGEEKQRMNENNQYYPTWIELEKIVGLDNLYPKLAKAKVLGLFCGEFDKIVIS
ncbi:NUDIX domain-containing protein [Patescibacteria group bacterium]|nr:NUDIX domain-containing protein [Patescibacteria group bacterium]